MIPVSSTTASGRPRLRCTFTSRSRPRCLQELGNRCRVTRAHLLGQSGWVREWGAVVVATATVALAACNGACPTVSCAPPSVRLDLRNLPSSLFRDAIVTGCYKGTCQTVPAGDAGDRSIAIPLTPRAAGTTALPRSTATIEIRIDAAGGRVFMASTRQPLPVWRKESRCADCKRGSIYAVVERDGSIRSRSPF